MDCPRPSRLALRRLALAALGGLAAVLGLSTAALLYLSSPPGERRLLAVALPRINAQIQGRLEVAALDLHPTGALELRGVALFDPEGQLVARIDELRAQLILPALAARRIEASSLEVHGALLALENQPGGVNLARALAPPRSSAGGGAGQSSSGPDVAFYADRIAIDGLAFQYRLAPKAPPLVSLERVFLHARGRLTGRGSQLEGDAAGELAAPIAGPFSLQVACQGGSDQGPFEPLAIQAVSLRGPSTRVQVSGRLSRAHLDAAVSELAVPRALLDALFPGHPLASGLSASGTFSVDARALAVDARIAAGAGQVHLLGKAGLSPFAPAAQATLSSADLASLFAGLPTTALNGRLEGALDAGSPRRGHLELALEPSRASGVTVASASASLALEGDEVAVRSFLADLPGGRVGLRGRARPDAVDLAVTLHLESASRFGAALERLFDVETPHLDGRGELTARLLGPPKAPRIEVAGRLSSLESGSFFVEGLSLQGEIPDARRPFLFRATAAAGRGRAGELPFTNLDLNVAAERRAFSADLSTAGLAGLKARLRGDIDPDHRGARMDRLELATRASRWAMAAPAHVDLRDGFLVDHLLLRSGDQQLDARGGASRGALALAVEARRLELASIPGFLLPRALERQRLSGQVDLEAQLSGPLARPEVRGRLRGRALGTARLRGVDADLELALGAERVSGRLDLTRGPSRAQLAANLPRALWRAAGSAPVEAHARIERADSSDLARLASPTAALAGVADLDLDLAGTVERPGARAVLTAKRAAWREGPPADVRLQLDSNGETRASLTAKAGGAPLQASAQIGMPLGALLRRPAASALLSAPLQATLFAQGAPLAPFAGSVLPVGAEGAATVEGHLEGSLGAPRGELRASVVGGAVGRLTGLALAANVSARAGEVALSAKLGWHGAPAAALDVRLALDPVRSLDRGALFAAPVEAHLQLRSIDLPSALGYSRDLAAGKGSLEATLRGTLGDPSLDVAASTSSLASGDKSLGRLEAKGAYRAKEASLAAQVLPAAGGSAALSADVGVDLSLPSLLKGPDWAAAPVTARLSSKDLDLKTAALFAPARQLLGSLTLSGEVTGTLGSPVPRGSAQLRGGQVALPGFGTWREVDLDLSASDRHLEVSRLKARAGNGSLMFDARGDRASTAEPYQIQGRLEAKNLPLVANDRLVAFLTGATEHLTGQLHGTSAAFDVRLGRVQVQLPELIGGKELQPLEAHPDVFVRLGKAPSARQLAAAAEPEPAGEQGVALQIHLVAPDNVELESSDLKAVAGVDVTGTLRSGRLELKGEAVLKDGRAEALGRRFDIRRSKLTWSSDPVGDPHLDLRATHDNLREQVKVKVAITGTAQKPKLELSSEPALDETEIATLIATGRRELKRGSGGVTAGSGAASVAGNFLASRLRRLLSNKVPLDVLQVEVGADTRAQQTRVEAGTYVKDRIYLGYRRNFGADTEHGENANEVRVEYQISPRVSVESEYGDQGRGGANVVFSKDY